ncbi:MAG: zinc ribbon domain-containing protein, partial [Oscillospiraceae bacterium]|nr:zinc ribbon domain-containing protein [Oscillospiraceae bacterium]
DTTSSRIPTGYFFIPFFPDIARPPNVALFSYIRGPFVYCPVLLELFKHTWLSGLLKCGCCGYSVKVNKDGNKYYLVCSGRSNLGLCKQAIRVDLRTLEESVAAELERLLAECPDIEADTYEDQAYTSALAEIDQKINRLIDALTGSSDITMAYVNRAIQKLEGQKQALLDERARRQSKPSIHLQRVQFTPLDFEEKKMVAAQFVKEINLIDDRAEVIWNV